MPRKGTPRSSNKLSCDSTNRVLVVHYFRSNAESYVFRLRVVWYDGVILFSSIQALFSNFLLQLFERWGVDMLIGVTLFNVLFNLQSLFCVFD